MENVKLGNLVGDQMEENFLEFDLTEIHDVLKTLEVEGITDLAHAEMLQQKALRGADILSEFLGRIVKTVSYLETKINRTKNRVALDYKAPEGRTTAEMKKWAGEASPEVEELQIQLSKAKASKVVLEKKYDILIRSHHHYKEIANGLRRSILGYTVSVPKEKIPEGYE